MKSFAVTDGSVVAGSVVGAAVDGGSVAGRSVVAWSLLEDKQFLRNGKIIATYNPDLLLLRQVLPP